MSNYHIAFNTIMLQVMEKVKQKASSTSPLDKKLHATIDLVIESPTINVHVPLDRFIKDIYMNYRTPMYNGDEEFFMNENYEIDDKNIISVIKSMYCNSSNEEKNDIKAKVKKLVSITDKYLTSKEKL